jgi:hypothetical protein
MENNISESKKRKQHELNELTSSISNLENMMESIPKFEQKDEVEKNLKEALPRVGTIDFKTIKENSYNEAEKMINSIIEYYIEPNMHDSHIINSFRESDRLTIGELLIDMKTSEHIMMKVSEAIDTGDINPRLLESYTKMQDSKMNIIKHLKQVELVIRTNYMKFQSEHSEKMLELEDKNSNSYYIESGNTSNNGIPKQLTMQSVDNENELTITSEKTTIRAKPRAFAQKMHQILANKSRLQNAEEIEEKTEIIEEDIDIDDDLNED